MSSEIFGAKTANAIATESAAPRAPKVERELTPLQRLKEEATKSIERTVTYAVAQREGWSAVYDTNISPDDYKRYTRSAQGKKKRPEDADIAVFSGMALIERNVGITYNGALVESEDGEDVTFSSDEFLEMFPAESAVKALEIFMGGGFMISTASALYKESGFGEEATAQDPSDA